ncbi:MAG: hypothetical protein ACRC1H_14095 [Caldilineaceae bacterium]
MSYSNLDLHYLAYQEKLNECRKNYRLAELPRRRFRLPSWQEIRALLFL